MLRRLLLGALFLSSLAVSFAWGVLAGRDETFPFHELRSLYHAVSDKPAGRWRPAPDAAAPSPDDETRSALLALPYLQGYEPAPQSQNVIRYEKDRSYSGLNLYVSGHAAEAILMDMHGKELHKWSLPYEKVWQDDNPSTGAKYWRRAHALPNGDLLAIFEGIGLVKLDKGSRLLWSYRGGCHHDLWVDDAGEISVLTRQSRVVPRINPQRPVVEDFVTRLSPDGEALRSFSLLRAFEDSPYSAILDRVNRKKAGDIFHTNTIEVLDGSLADRAPAFRKGNILVSILYLDAIAVIDPGTEKVVWALSGMWRRQHQPTVLGNGHMLLFDNLGHGGRSRVLELDPFTQRLFWRYGEAPG
ncbi:MAG: arylsulfotransferase family protein, partial [Candidatus Binatia bacterium]